MIDRIKNTTQYSKYVDFISGLYLTDDSIQLLNHFKKIQVPRPFQIRIKLFYSKLPYSKITEFLERNVEITKFGKSGISYNLKTSIGKVNIRAVSTYFAILNTEEKNIFMLATISTSEEWNVILRFLKKGYPTIVPIYLSQRELKNVIMKLEQDQNQFGIRVSAVGLKERITKKSKKLRKTFLGWTDESVDEVLSQISERNQLLKNISLKLYDIINQKFNIAPTAEYKINKNSEIFITGNFNIVYDIIIPNISKIGFEKLSSYSNRGLRDSNYKPAPLSITFSSDVLDNTEEFRRFTSILEHYPQSRHIVRHGNPYSNVTISDMFDGSSFDIWAVTSNNVLIVPRLKATEAAIERLVHYIFDEFHEGLVRDAS